MVLKNIDVAVKIFCELSMTEGPSDKSLTLFQVFLNDNYLWKSKNLKKL